VTPTLRPVVFALAAFATACAGAGPAARPAEVPASFSRSGRAAVPDRWWLAIDHAALHSLIEIGLGDNPGLRATWDRLAQADAAARREGATALPTVSGDAGASASIRLEGTSSSLSLGLAASYEVDLWGGIDAAREAAALERRRLAAEHELVELRIALYRALAGGFDLEKPAA
jgi:outer membrane protein TolC